jgi:hypothetical protein
MGRQMNPMQLMRAVTSLVENRECQLSSKVSENKYTKMNELIKRFLALASKFIHFF